MAGDKRTIISSKRLRNRRRKAMRAANAHAIADASSVDPAPAAIVVEASTECDISVIPTAAPASPAEGELRLAQGVDDSDASDVEDDSELVIVCRPTVQDFCTEFVAFADDSILNKHKAVDFKRFTARIPAFRETREGYITYTIVVSTCSEPKKHFQLERRFSEFVALASGLDLSLKASNDPSLSQFNWELPPKTWFRVTQVTALEERRGQLEASLETLLAQEDGKICRLPLIRDFLMLDLFGAHVVEEKQAGL
ncbi:TPA: hypothetical protein N0F65_000762 [Lagenidium giganteum]|uniref:PX domain-containing protein n=1 Tax=Lagenidium giganteum TaxID=4803 RepID=A0AAV2ZKW9_9STRA|nr:TPA: hypothetical protein N0F65_000762 [Lagenidium giganteum]